MLLKEFEDLTGTYPDEITYQVIEEEYYIYLGTKQQFCRDYKSNKNGMAQRIQHKANTLHKEANDAYLQQIDDLKSNLEKLGMKLEREEEWKPYGTLSSMSTEAYEKLANSCTEEMSEERIKEIIENICNFDYSKVHIITEINVYEENRHKQLRSVGKESRKPLYFSSDYNYIRFNSGYYQYEYVDGILRFYED